MKYVIPGFPSHTSDVIESPNIAELLFMPIFSRCDPDRFRKYASDYQKHLLDRCPLVGNYKHLVVDSYTQFMYPTACPVGSRSEIGQLYEWHCDGWKTIADEKPSTFHIFETDGEASTVFNENPIELDLPDDLSILHFNNLAVLNAEQWGVKAEKMEHNRFITFSRHLHSASQPKHKQFRYFFRVTESDHISPDLQREQPRPGNPCFRLGSGGLSKSYENINRRPDGIEIKFIQG